MISLWEDQCEWHIITKMTGLDCAVESNLIDTHTHTHSTQNENRNVGGNKLSSGDGNEDGSAISNGISDEKDNENDEGRGV